MPEATTPQPPDVLLPAAICLFADRLPLAVRYADLLTTLGPVRGLIGPSESSRIWPRHLLNCAAVAELIPLGAYVVDVGSGAGLPGLVLAIARRDLRVVLMEPLLRRTTFLTEVIGLLGLSDVTVVRGRAEEYPRRQRGDRTVAGVDVGTADVVTVRAVAALDRLATWCLPLLADGGRLLALKGDSAQMEAAQSRSHVQALGGAEPTVRRCGVGVIDPPTTVVEITKVRASQKRRSSRPS